MTIRAILNFRMGVFRRLLDTSVLLFNFWQSEAMGRDEL